MGLLEWYKVAGLDDLAKRAILVGCVNIQCHQRLWCDVAKGRGQAAPACAFLCTLVQHGSPVCAAQDARGVELVRCALRAWKVLTEADMALARDLGLDCLVQVGWPCPGCSCHSVPGV